MRGLRWARWKRYPLMHGTLNSIFCPVALHIHALAAACIRTYKTRGAGFSSRRSTASSVPFHGEWSVFSAACTLGRRGKEPPTVPRESLFLSRVLRSRSRVPRARLFARARVVFAPIALAVRTHPHSAYARSADAETQMDAELALATGTPWHEPCNFAYEL